jgi:hypothetical protein
MTDVADISKVLRKMNVAEDLILPSAKKMSGIKNADEIAKALGKIDLLQKNTKITNTVNPLFEEAKKYKSAEEFVKQANTVNPTGSVFAEYTPALRNKIPIGENIQTLEKSIGGKPDDVVTIYRGTTGKNINPGDFVTTNKLLAKDYAGNGKVVEMNVRKKDIIDTIDEPGMEEYIYKPNADRLQTYTKSQLTDIWNEANKSKPLTTQDKFLNILKEKEVSKPEIPKIEDTRTPAQMLTDALKEAKPLRKEQEKIYTKERGEKIAKAIKVGENTKGEQGFYSQLSAMKGSMKEVEADFESLRAKLPQETIDSLFEQIKNSKALTEWEKLPAGKALAKMFGEYGGKVPTKNEIEKLETVFGKETIEALVSHRSTFDKFKENGLQLANLPRSLMSSFDLSAPLRQGIFMTSKPKQFFSAFKEMFKVAGSEKAFNELMTNINTRPTSQLMRDNRLAITNVSSTLNKREEAFMSSWAEKIPVMGKGVKMSEQAYVGFLNKLRADVFDEFVRKGDELGIDDPKYLKDAANFINNATGRGSLKDFPVVGKTLEEGAPILNAAFFSPKLMASRFNMLIKYNPVNPFFYKLHPQVQKEAFKSLVAFSSIIGTSLALARMGGAEVETDPRSSDFAKIKLGNTRYDIMGGFQQPIKLAFQEFTGETKNSTTGEIKKLGQGYNSTTRLDILAKFFENKESPLMSFVVGMLSGTNAIGEKFDMPTEIANRFVPIITQDIQDLYKEKGEKGLAMVIPGLFGVGTQTYGGVQSFGLKGKDYPEVNSELDRLNISMGFPSTTVFNEDLNLKEYKALKEKTGKTVASVMKTLMDSDEYKQLPDEGKVKILERATDKVKAKVKEQMFPDKKIKSIIKTKLEAKGLKNEELEQMTEKVYSQIDLSQLPQ